MIRVGLIGYGLAGAIFHEPLIRGCDGLSLTAVLTSRDHPLRAASIDELLGKCELVVIASPNPTHFALAATALNAGKHVVVDKPFTVTVDEANELIALARDSGRMLTVFHNRRWDGDFLTVRKLLPSLGEPFLFEAHWDRFRPQIKQGWREQAEPGSGLLADLGPHMIDQALQLFGLPDAISADVLAQRPDAEVEDYIDLRLDYGHLRVCLRSSTLMIAPRPRFAVHGTEGSFVKYGLDPQETQLKAGVSPSDEQFGRDPIDGVLTFADGRSEPVPTERGCYLEFYRAVAASIADGAPVPVDPLDARDGVAIIDLARRAAAAGQRLPFPAANSRAG